MTATTVFLAPFYNGTTQLLANGQLNINGNLWTYLAGTNTAANTFTSNTGQVLNPNPMTIGSQGLFPHEIWIPAAQNTKFLITDAANNTLDTQDNVQGIADPSYVITVANSAYLIANAAFGLANTALGYAVQALNSANGALFISNSASNTAAIYANANLVLYAANVNFNNSGTINIQSSADGTLRSNVGFQLNSNSFFLPTSDGGNLALGFANVSSNCYVQWGNVNLTSPIVAGSPRSITFPEPFPQLCWTVQCTMDSTGVNQTYIPRPFDLSATGFTLYMDGFGQSGQLFSTTNVFWIAVGS